MIKPTIALHSQIERTAAQIANFANLPNGWRFGEGVPPSAPTIRKALLLVQAAAAIPAAETEAYPGTNGEIQVAVFHGHDYLEFTIEADGTITFVREENDTRVERTRGLTLRAAREKIHSIIGGPRWDISDWFARPIGVSGEDVSLAWHSIPRQKTDVSQSSARSVLKSPVGEFAPILANAMQTTFEGTQIILTSFGGSPIRHYQ